jgi:hypothetical protein
MFECINNWAHNGALVECTGLIKEFREVPHIEWLSLQFLKYTSQTVAEELSVRKEPPDGNNMVPHDVSPPLRTSIKFYTELGKAFRGTKRSFVKLLYV